MTTQLPSKNSWKSFREPLGVPKSRLRTTVCPWSSNGFNGNKRKELNISHMWHFRGRLSS